MADPSFWSSIVPIVYPWLKLGIIAFVILLLTVVGVVVIVEKRRRKWKIEVHEQKADGKLHTIGYDKLVEKRLKMGTKTIYWMRKAKVETIPPPAECVDRFKGKEEVDYLRVMRDYIPCTKKMSVDYNDPAINQKVVSVHDKLVNKIRNIRTTFFNSDAVSSNYIFIPINKTLTSNMTFVPIDYDMNMMAMNEIHNADEFYQGKYEFWKKYGAIIVFGLTIVFLIVLIVLTYEYMQGAIAQIMGKVGETSGLLQNVIDKIGGVKPPS